MEVTSRSDLFGIVTSPVALLTDAFASFSLPKEMQRTTALVPALQSNWLMMHVTVMMISYVALISGSLLALAFLVVNYYDKKALEDAGTFALDCEGGATRLSTGKGDRHALRPTSPQQQLAMLKRPSCFVDQGLDACIESQGRSSLFAETAETTPIFPAIASQASQWQASQASQASQEQGPTPKGVPSDGFGVSLNGSSLQAVSAAEPTRGGRTAGGAIDEVERLVVVGEADFANRVAIDLPLSSLAEKPGSVVSAGFSPFAQTLDNLSYRTLGLGFPLLTIGILSGAVWANEAWGSYWSWDPKETWALITWLVFAIYLHTRLSKGWRGNRPALIAVAGFFVVWICYLGVNLLGTGLHSYGWFQARG